MVVDKKQAIVILFLIFGTFFVQQYEIYKLKKIVGVEELDENDTKTVLASEVYRIEGETNRSYSGLYDEVEALKADIKELKTEVDTLNIFLH